MQVLLKKQLRPNGRSSEKKRKICEKMGASGPEQTHSHPINSSLTQFKVVHRPHYSKKEKKVTPEDPCDKCSLEKMKRLHGFTPFSPEIENDCSELSEQPSGVITVSILNRSLFSWIWKFVGLIWKHERTKQQILPHRSHQGSTEMGVPLVEWSLSMKFNVYVRQNYNLIICFWRTSVIFYCFRKLNCQFLSPYHPV